MDLIIHFVAYYLIGNVSGSVYLKEWEEFKRKHNKQYSASEDLMRQEIFQKKLAQVKKSLNDVKNGTSTHYLALNQFSDMTNKERNQYLSKGLIRIKRGISTLELHLNSTNPAFHVYTADSSVLPDCVDLRTTGWKEPVRYQGSCRKDEKFRSCWAISVSSLVSFHHFNKTKKNRQFSPQNLIDCANIYGASGCLGGNPIHALMYILTNKQTMEPYYPYTGLQSSCNIEKLKTAPTHHLNGFLLVHSNQESIKQCVAKIGPVSVSIAADHLFDHGGGIWTGTTNEKACKISKINHTVTIVGYCIDSTTKQSYWIIKNSWGSSWGENGYFRMLMNNTNLCGLWKFPYAVY